MAKKEATKPSNPISRGLAFLKESWEELKKVHTPGQQETIQATMVVLAIVCFFAFFLGVADWIVGGMMRSILT